MAVDFIIHDGEDVVGVATRDLDPSSRATGRYQRAEGEVELEVLQSIPLGHKIAITDVPEGGPVVKYGVSIGRATAAIRAGEHVHTHNLKGERWA